MADIWVELPRDTKLMPTGLGKVTVKKETINVFHNGPITEDTKALGCTL
jgi:hypothetical protein